MASGSRNGSQLPGVFSCALESRGREHLHTTQRNLYCSVCTLSDMDKTCQLDLVIILVYHNMQRITIPISKGSIEWISLHCVQFFVRFGPVTPEFTLLTITPFAAKQQKSPYHAKNLRISWTYLDLLYRFGSRIGGDDYPNIRWPVARGTLLWQQRKFGRCPPMSHGTTFTLWSGIRQRIGQS